ncbi:hypothetical protein E4U46_006144 [Claviceps purpurea]|nr:hypothetical protein E4U46_006144 [Claviceps purpurea]
MEFPTVTGTRFTSTLRTAHVNNFTAFETIVEFLRKYWLLGKNGTTRHAASSFELSGAQRDGFIHKFWSAPGQVALSITVFRSTSSERLNINIDTHANIFSDEPDAGRNISDNIRR